MSDLRKAAEMTTYVKATWDKCQQEAWQELAKQEPVAWLSVDCIGERYLCFSKPADGDKTQPLYTAPPKREWIGLTDDEIGWVWHNSPPNSHEYARAIEAKLKEKNT